MVPIEEVPDLPSRFDEAAPFVHRDRPAVEGGNVNEEPLRPQTPRKGQTGVDEGLAEALAGEMGGEAEPDLERIAARRQFDEPDEPSVTVACRPHMVLAEGIVEKKGGVVGIRGGVIEIVGRIVMSGEDLEGSLAREGAEGEGGRRHGTSGGGVSSDADPTCHSRMRITMVSSAQSSKALRMRDGRMRIGESVEGGSPGEIPG